MTIHCSRRAMHLFLLSVVLGCQGSRNDQGDTGKATVLSQASGPTISSEAVQQFDLPAIGPGPHDLTDLRGVLVAEDGSVGAADAGCPCVFIFGPAGKLLATIGRAGSGPGEFREPTLVAFWGDSLAVFDPPQRRLSYFRSDGSLIRQRPVAVPGTMAFSIAGIRTDGALIFKGTMLEAPPAGSTLQRLKALVLAIDAQDRLDTLAVIDDGLWHPNGPLWYAWRSAVAVTDSGIWYGNGGRPELSFLRWDGAVGQTLRWTGLTRAVDDHDRQVITEIAGSHKASPALTAPDRFADSIPYFGRLLPDPAGGIWVIASTGPFAASDSAWWIDPMKGTISGLGLPARFRPMQIQQTFVLGTSTDEDGAYSIVRYALHR